MPWHCLLFHLLNISANCFADIWTWEEVLTKVGRKDKMALQIASNCASHSGREAYTNELGKYMEITGYGRCFGRDCDKMCYDAQLGLRRGKMLKDNEEALSLEGYPCTNELTRCCPVNTFVLLLRLVQRYDPR
uniref:Fucosyltransferase n=1 Tax=Globodera rostochiensis TaxID=31243 RepID=A0A914GV88_GLORO